jgi:hypothetical protein
MTPPRRRRSHAAAAAARARSACCAPTAPPRAMRRSLRRAAASQPRRRAFNAGTRAPVATAALRRYCALLRRLCAATLMTRPPSLLASASDPPGAQTPRSERVQSGVSGGHAQIGALVEAHADTSSRSRVRVCLRAAAAALGNAASDRLVRHARRPCGRRCARGSACCAGGGVGCRSEAAPAGCAAAVAPQWRWRWRLRLRLRVLAARWWSPARCSRRGWRMRR